MAKATRPTRNTSRMTTTGMTFPWRRWVGFPWRTEVLDDRPEQPGGVHPTHRTSAASPGLAGMRGRAFPARPSGGWGRFGPGRGRESPGQEVAPREDGLTWPGRLVKCRRL